MILLPAIDLYDGKAVRLLRGDYANMTVYGENAAAFADAFADAGAEWVHMVDLEGAKAGTTPNFSSVAAVARAGRLKVEIGGGIRSDDTVARYLDAGVSRVILGTAALRDRAFLARCVARHAEKIAVGVDIRDGFVATHGWTETSAVACETFCAEPAARGVQTTIVTSGGVSSLEDLRAMRGAGLYGAILGKAYYTGAVDLKEALEACK